MSVDDILDSLGRRVGFSSRLHEDASAVFDNEDPGLNQSIVLPGPLIRKGRVAMGKFAFVVVLLAGVFMLWTYGALRSLTDVSGIVRLVQGPALPSVFTDPVKLVVVLFVCLLPILLLRKRRSREPLLYE